MNKTTISTVLCLVLMYLSIGVQAQQQQPLASDSLEQVSGSSSFKTFIPGLAALTYGTVALGDNFLRDLDVHIRNRRNEQRPGFHTYADDYLRYVPYIAVMGMDLVGVKGKHAVQEKAGLLLTSVTLAYGSTYVLKRIANKERPNGENQRSFPSGHATVVFAGAEMFHQEYGKLSPWYSIAGYTVASATAVLRIYNNDHWWSDVVAGAGVGILSTKLVYLLYPKVKSWAGGKDQAFRFKIHPVYEQRSMGLALSGKF